MIANLRAMIGGMRDEISRHLFEIYDHRIFLKGGKTSKCRNLEDDSESELELDELNGHRTPMGKILSRKLLWILTMSRPRMTSFLLRILLANKECSNLQ